MSERIPQSVAKRVVFRAFLASDHVSVATGKTIAITISKNGGAFGNPAAGATNATEIASGFYYFDLGTGDTGTLGPLAYRGAEGTIDDVGDVFSVTDEIQAIKAQTAAIETDTQDIQTRLPAALVSGRIDASVGAMAANVMTAAAAAADLTTELQSGLATAAALTTVEGKIDTIDGIVDAILDDTGTSGVVVAAGSKTGYTLTATTGLGNQTANITGNLSGSVGSVTGAVGSVTGNVGGNVTGSVGSVATGGITAASLAADTITAAKVAADVTTEIQSGLATASAVSTLQTSVNDLPTNAELATALGTADDAVLAAIGALSIPTADQNADALLKRDWTAVTGEAARSALNALRFLRNKWSISGGTLTVTEEDDTTTAWTGTVTTAAGNPTTQIDPS